MIYRPDSGKRLSHQNLAKFALCRKILRRQDNYPPRNSPCVAKFYEDRITIPPDDLNAALGRNRRLWARIDRRIFNEKLMLFWCYDRQKKEGFTPIERLIITNFRTVERRFSDTRKARKRPVFRHLRTFSQWQGQNGSNVRHAVLEAMLKILSRSDFSPVLGICCQPRRWCFRNWCFFDDIRNSAPDFWCSWWWIWIPRFGLWEELQTGQEIKMADRQCTKYASH